MNLVVSNYLSIRTLHEILVVGGWTLERGFQRIISKFIAQCPSPCSMLLHSTGLELACARYNADVVPPDCR